jgi:hypothetical protein
MASPKDAEDLKRLLEYLLNTMRESYRNPAQSLWSRFRVADKINVQAVSVEEMRTLFAGFG